MALTTQPFKTTNREPTRVDFLGQTPVNEAPSSMTPRSTIVEAMMRASSVYEMERNSSAGMDHQSAFMGHGLWSLGNRGRLLSDRI